MVFNHDHHHLELEKLLHDKMTKLYIFQALMTFVKSLIGVFVPVYLYKVGYSFSMILLYVIIISAMYLFLIPISIKIINNLGFKKTIILSIPIYFIHILTINFLKISEIFFYLSAISFGLYISFFWPAMHAEIAMNGSNKHRGSQMGTLQIITTIFSTLAPIIGGIILEIKGYYSLLIFTSIIILLSSIPILKLSPIPLKKFTFKYSNYIKFIKLKNLHYTKLSFISEGIESTLSFTLWPILLYIILDNNFATLGTLYTLVSLFSVLIILYIKNYIDKSPKNKTLSIITKLLSTNWFFRSLILFFSSFLVYIVESFAKLITSVFTLSYFSIFYNNAKNSNYMEYIIFREFFLHSTKIFFGIFLIILLNFLPANIITFSYIILIGIIASMGLNKISEIKNI